MSRPRPPKSLGQAGRAFWRRVLPTCELSPAGEIILARCCRTMDVLDRLDVAPARRWQPDDGGQRWFGLLTDKRLRRGTHRSVQASP